MYSCRAVHLAENRSKWIYKIWGLSAMGEEIIHIFFTKDVDKISPMGKLLAKICL